VIVNCRRCGRGADDRGDTLVEIMMAVAIFMAAGAAILGGFTTVITGTAVHRDQADVETVIRNSAESVVRPTTSYIPCATTSSYSSAVVSAPNVNQSISRVEYWDGATGGGAFQSSCPSGDLGLQRITIHAVKLAAGAQATEDVMVLKRKTS
jgi:type II secretory pathway pseudopilin PulG